MTKPVIPAAVLALLKQRWQPTQEGFSVFDNVWEGRDRKEYPSWYFYREGSDGAGCLSFEEAKGLLAVPELAPMLKGQKDTVSVNEHLDHAISDFCSQVYDAFDAFLERAEQIKKAQNTDMLS